MDNELIKIKLK